MKMRDILNMVTSDGHMGKRVEHIEVIPERQAVYCAKEPVLAPALYEYIKKKD
jgi:hypothetical protein